MPILSLLTQVDLNRMVRDRRWPKWSTQCYMYSLGLEVLDACLVTPENASRLAEAAEVFARLHGVPELMVRSDGGSENVSYERGGNSLDLAQSVELAERLISQGRAVLFLEPTNRFTNRLTAMIRIDRDPLAFTAGTLTIELLGPGYDLADLARSGTQPQARIEISNVDWESPGELWPSDVHLAEYGTADTVRIAGRLDFIARRCLGHSEATDQTARIELARAWLLERDYRGLFDSFDPRIALCHLADWYRDAFKIAHGFPWAGWTCLATGWSDLGSGRMTYWDVVDGRSKYG